MDLVKDIMTKSVINCSPQADLIEVSRLMKTYNCGLIPVTNEDGTLVGVITDRDVCLELSESIPDVGSVEVENVMKTNVHICHMNDKVKDALEMMRDKQVRRLPVLNSKGKLMGVLSLTDIWLNARTNDLSIYSGGLTTEEIMDTYTEISVSRIRQLQL